jgi:hypothetical protein
MSNQLDLGAEGRRKVEPPVQPEGLGDIRVELFDA